MAAEAVRLSRGGLGAVGRQELRGVGGVAADERALVRLEEVALDAVLGDLLPDHAPVLQAQPLHRLSLIHI